MTKSVDTADMVSGGIVDYLNNLSNQFFRFKCEIGELVARWEDDRGYDDRVQRRLVNVTYAGNTYRVTDRFINSLSSRFCFGRSIFNFFTPEEVFERLQMVEPQTDIRVVHYNGEVLAATNPSKSYVDFDSLASMLSRKCHRIEKIKYEKGILTAIHRMDDEWDVNGDKFAQMFYLSVPVDGYGLPTINLALKRKSSGAYLIAGSKAFKSEIQLGTGQDYPEAPLKRAIDTFNNEEGFQAIRQRMGSAQKSPASMNEVNGLYKCLKKSARTASKWWIIVHENLVKLAGRVDQKFGIATMESISTRKARLLPMQCSVADLINFSIEIATGPVSEVIPDHIHSWVGETLANEFDLEGTANDKEVTLSDNYMEELTKIDSPFLIKANNAVLAPEVPTARKLDL